MKNMPAHAESQSPSVQSHDESTTKPKNNFLFAMTPNDVMSRKGISPGAKNVFGVIFSLQQASIGRCILSNESIAERTALTVQQVKRLFRVLENAELIKRIKKKGSDCTRESIEVLWKPSSEPNRAVVANQPHQEAVRVAGQPQNGSAVVATQPQTDELSTNCTQQQGTYCTQSDNGLAENCTQQQGTICTPEKTSEEILSVGEVSKSGRATDDDAQIKSETKQTAIPHDVLEEVRGLLGDDLVSKIAKAAKPFRDVVCDRWDALVDAADILADKIALEDEIRHPVKCLLGITKNVHAKLLNDDRLTEHGELEVSFWSGIDMLVVQSLHDELVRSRSSRRSWRTERRRPYWIALDPAHQGASRSIYPHDSFVRVLHAGISPTAAS